MPPKGKKPGKKKGEKRPAKAPASVESVNELSKQYYVVELEDLECRLERYEKKYEQLLAKNSNYETELDRTLQDQKESVAVYGKTLEQRVHELADIKDRLIGLQQAKDVEHEWYERELQHLGIEYKETRDQLIAENIHISSQLAMLDDFKTRKSEFMAKLASLEAQVQGQKVSNKEVLEQLDRKDVMARDRMKGQMLTRLNQVAAAFRKISQQEMAETTKRTIRENVVVTSQLGKMSEQTTDIGQDNVSLKDRVIAGRRQIQEMEEREKELTRNYVSSRKIIEMLTNQIDKEKNVVNEFELADENYNLLQIESDVLREKLKTKREEVVKANAKRNALKKDLEAVQHRLREEDEAVNILSTIISEAAAKLKSSLMAPAVQNNDDDGSTVNDKNKNILEEVYHHLLNGKINHATSPNGNRRQNSNSAKTSRTANNSNLTKSQILPPINLNGSMMSLKKFIASEHSDEDLPETKDAGTQTRSSNKIPPFPSNLLIGKLTLSECEQVLMSQVLDD